MSGEQVSMQTYLDTRFEDLKDFLNEKFDNLEKADDDLSHKVGQLDIRVARLEKWKAVTYGACAVIGIILKFLYDAILYMVK